MGRVERMTYAERQHIEKAMEEQRLYEEFVYKLATKVSQQAIKLSTNVFIGSELKTLALELGNYLKDRKESDRDSELEKRALFIENCLKEIVAGNRARLEVLLKEEEILPFKGFFSKKLYSIAKTYQSIFSQRREEKEMIEMKSIPAAPRNSAS